ncbi:carboxypeptidase family protein [Sphingobacterium allocomposti]|uniref:Carboxypeptidase family protein n=1 Tax=Sphingobacterium allocomposti TaxID=415956 RepID=A0A5S5DL71_9SPHI|nr:carboxypeptidase regulatory-like domain-containing protein [Sphingobacterium composti Yoo et al. 2007 non Ten et al. 2007]TYP96374.1 carboxypeptidase family protein [Sphingobacterium composti Yoo et al. 2007 non Ten et al. 2007]
MINKVAVIFLLLIAVYSVSAQVNTLRNGLVEGQIKDTVLNRVLPTATVSVYSESEYKLLGYTLTDREGVFKIADLPAEQALKLVVSYLGYTQLQRSFTLRDGEKLKLGLLNMQIQPNMLEEIEITAVPPVRMNGDTLEFNASAFHLDPNAVAEDLLKKLPGVVVWGDGMITVNGREIDALLVNGKPFFGGHSKIATQNIAKNAIEKVQVYKKNLMANAIDSTTAVNLVLKEPNAIGYFGKGSIGAGFTNRHDLTANLNAFSAVNQFSGIIGSNNINKESNDIGVLIRNNTFKGSNLQSEYETDFSKMGDIRSRKAGFFAEHFLRSDLSNQNMNKIKIDYLRNIVDLDLRRDIDAITAINEDEDQRRKSADQTETNQKAHLTNGSYFNKIGNFSIDLTAKIAIERDNSQTNLIDSVMSTASGLLSSRRQGKNIETDRKLLDLNFSVGHDKDQDRSFLIPGDWKIDYGLKTVDKSESSRNVLDFTAVSQSFRQDFDRLSDYRHRAIEHRFAGRYGNLLKSILRRQIYNNSIELVGDLTLGDRRISNIVADISGGGLLADNNNLSYDRKEDYVDLQGGIVWTYSGRKQLSGRFSTRNTLSIDVRNQIFSLNNTSNRSFQNLSLNYSRILPKISYSITHHKDRRFQNSFKADLLSKFNYPEIENLVPIVDSALVFDVNLGNRSLKPSNNRELHLSFTHRRLKTNAFVYSLYLKLSDIIDPLGFFTSIDSTGKSSYYMDNFDRSHVLDFGYETSQSYKFDNDQLQIRSSGNLNYSSLPNRLRLPDQSVFMNTTQSVRLRVNADLYYSFHEIVEASIKYAFLQNRITHEASRTTLTNRSHKIGAAALVKCGKKWVAGVEATHNSVTFWDMPSSFNIVNLKLSKRFLKQDNLELTLSGSDIFNQNQRLFFENTLYTNSQERQNMLRRYYLLSVAYYPRKFTK